jgi:hypothetical protein
LTIFSRSFKEDRHRSAFIAKAVFGWRASKFHGHGEEKSSKESKRSLHKTR